MATLKLMDTVCGFPESLLISQTPMICRLLLKSSGSISHKYQSTKKWLNSLTKMLQNSIANANQNQEKEDNNHKDEEEFLSFDSESNTKAQNAKKKDTKQSASRDMDLNGIWSSLTLLSATYRIISSGATDWKKQCEIILDLTENAQIFYNPVLRTRCFETLCELIEYSRFATDPNSYQVSLQFSAKLLRFVQNILFEIVLNDNNSLNCGGRLLDNVLMILYRLLSNGKNLNAKSNISRISRACFHCLKSNNHQIRSLAIGIIILLCNNDKKYNELIDETMYTLRYLLRDLFPAPILDKSDSIQTMDKNKCIDDILEIAPSLMEDMDSFARISLCNNLMNGLMFLLCHLLRRKNNKSLFCMNASRSTSSSSSSEHIKIVSASCSMNSFVIRVPLKPIFLFLMDIISIPIASETIKSGTNCMEFKFVINELYQNALWLLTTTIASVSKSLLPYKSVIVHILMSIAKETKALKCNMEYEIRSCLYQCITHILPILGPAIYDVLYKEIKIHLMNDLKAAQKLLMSSPPNASSVSQEKKRKLITSNPRKKQKLNESKDYNAGVYLQREYDTKLAYYGAVLRCVAAFFDICSNYMTLDEKSEIELILSAAILRCCSDSGHILINLCLMDLLNEFVATMVSVLRAPKMYKKAYLSLTAKLLSSAFGIGSLLANKALISNAINGKRYIESIVNPRSHPVYSKPLRAIDTHTNDRIASVRNINEWNRKMELEINEEKLINKKRTFAQLEQDTNEDNDDDDNNNDDNNNNDNDNDDDNNDLLLNGTETNNFVDDEENDSCEDNEENEEEEEEEEENDDDIEIIENEKNLDEEIESIMKDYAHHQNDNKYIDSDDNVEPLWSY